MISALKLPIFLYGVLGWGAMIAAAVDPFAVLDTEAAGLAKVRPTFKAEAALPYAPESAADQARGFRATAVDLNNNWRKDFIWTGAELDHTIELLTAPGEFTKSGFSVFFNKAFPKLEILPGELKSASGAVIPADRIRVLQLAPWKSTPRFDYTMLLWNPELENIKPGDQLNLVLFVDVPEKTPGGLYKGVVRLLAGGQAIPMNLELRVAGFQLPEAGDFGFDLNGNLYQPRDGYNSGQKGYVKENLKRYFDFYKSRRLNSISVYDNLPDLRYVNGRVTGRFADTAELAKAMKASGLKGRLFIDLRDAGYWANAVALKLNELQGKAPAGDLGITMAQRKPSTSPYPEKAKEIYGEIIRLLLKQARDEQWPEILIFADEELGNQFPLKINNYECYMPVILKEAPEHAVVVDNGIGWGRTTATEYAARDHVKYRQYNSWTDESLALAAKDQAEVWSYNYNATRLSFGFTQIRLNSKGHHQWADLWDASNYQWQYSRLSDKGVVTSLEMERIHEGCVDYAACEYLKSLIAEQAKSGNTELAEYGRKVLAEVSGDLPVVHTSAQNYSFLLSDADLTARRWKVFQAIEKLLGQQVGAKVAAGKPAMRIQKSLQAFAPKNDYVLKVRNKSGKILASADAPEDFWSDFLGPLTHLTEYEAQLRAFASNPEEFKKLNCPSYSVARLASLPEGLAISTMANHVMPKAPFRYERKDDDGDMWQDDCFEFFFGLPNGKLCHLMFNSAGAKTFINTGVVLPGKAIPSYIKSPVNQSGGTTNKLLIPWRYFGLKQQPLPGTVWEFNVGREMHTFRSPQEATLSWARLATSFHEQDKWGRLIFMGGDEGPALKIAPSLSVEPNPAGQVISGCSFKFNMESRASGIEKLTMCGELIHESGRKIRLPEVSAPVGAAELELDTTGMEPGMWRFQVWVKGESRLASNIMRMTVLPTPWK